MATNGGPNIIEDGLVFAVDAANKKSYPGSGTTWTDLAGSNNGTLTNGPTFDSGNGGVIDFDGSDDRTDFSTNVFNGLSNTGITIEAWINPDNVSSQALIAGVWAQTAGNDQVSLFIINSKTFIAVADGSTAESGAGPGSNSLLVGEWQHVVGTWKTDRTYETFNNGVSQGTGTQTGNGYNSSSTGTFRVGAQVQGSSRYFNGKIANVKIYNRALSSSEVTQNYNALKSRFGL
jgi:hypothetical protein